MREHTEWIIATMQANKWTGPWGCEGLDVTDDIYVNNCDTTIDGDYAMWYLLEVCEHDRTPDGMRLLHGPDLIPGSETWVSYLAVATLYGGERQIVHAEWYPATNRFFDRETTPITGIRHWFVDWVLGTHAILRES